MKSGNMPDAHVSPNKTQNEDVSAQQLAKQPNKISKLLTELQWVHKVAYLTILSIFDILPVLNLHLMWIKQ